MDGDSMKKGTSRKLSRKERKAMERAHQSVEEPSIRISGELGSLRLPIGSVTHALAGGRPCSYRPSPGLQGANLIGGATHTGLSNSKKVYGDGSSPQNLYDFISSRTIEEVRGGPRSSPRRDSFDQ
jgi:hypothetical protein